MTEQAQAQEQDGKIIKVGEKYYDADNLTTNGSNILHDLAKVDGQLTQQKLAVSITELAKGTLMQKLEMELPNFTELDPSDEVKAQFGPAPEVATQAPVVEAELEVE